MTALLLGTVLAVGALAFVLLPLFTESRAEPTGAGRQSDAPGLSESASAVEALREVEFDRATGKLSDADYATLKAEYTRDAIAAMRAEKGDVPDAAPPEDEAVEAVILRYRSHPRSCVRCGPRPEPDAIYCSTCGHTLAA